MEYRITHVQIFDFKDHIQTSESDFDTVDKFSANVIVNDSFIIQVGSDDKIDIPPSSEVYWRSEEEQDFASENVDLDDCLIQILGDDKPDRVWFTDNFTPDIFFRNS